MQKTIFRETLKEGCYNLTSSNVCRLLPEMVLLNLLKAAIFGKRMLASTRIKS